MDCNLTWFNLPNQLKQIGEDLKLKISVQAYNLFQSITWWNMPIKLDMIFAKLKEEFPSCIPDTCCQFLWFTLDEKAEKICVIKHLILSCTPPPPTPTYNFRISSFDANIIDNDSLKNILQLKGMTLAVVTNFEIVGVITRNEPIEMQAIVSGNVVTNYDLSNLGITYIEKLGNISGVVNINLNSNNFNLLRYSQSEPWANNFAVLPGRGTINFSNNTDSISNTALETILIAKGFTVIS